MAIYLHCGAGHHDRSNKALISVIQQSLQYGRDQLFAGCEPEKVAVMILSHIESKGVSNAGRGSSKRQNGELIGEASLSVPHRSVSVAGVECQDVSPVKVARNLFQKHDNPSSLLRTPRFMYGNSSIQPNDDVSYMSEAIAPSYHDDHDTIGCVVVAQNGDMAMAVSSGGTAQSDPGRIGSSAVHGAGFWMAPSLAICASGCGEDIIQTQLAHTCGSALKSLNDHEFADDILASTLRMLRSEHVEAFALNGELAFQAGVFAARYEDKTVEMMAAFTTRSVAIGSIGSGKPCAKIILNHAYASGGVAQFATRIKI